MVILMEYRSEVFSPRGSSSGIAAGALQLAGLGKGLLLEFGISWLPSQHWLFT